MTLLVLETVIGAGADTLQADPLRRQQDGVVQEGHPGSDAECLQEPGADDAIVDNGVPAGGQSPGRRAGGLGHDLVLAVCRGGPGRDVALVDEREELVPRDQGAGVEEPRWFVASQCCTPDPRGTASPDPIRIGATSPSERWGLGAL